MPSSPRIGDSSPGRNHRNFRIPGDEYDPAAAKADREGRTLTWIVRHALRLYVRGQLPMPSDDESPSPAEQETGSGPE